MSNLTVQQKTAKDAIQKSLNVMGDEIKKALPKHMDVSRFSRVVMTAVSRTPKLLDCNQHSFFGSLLLAAQLGLEPNGPDQKCYLIPYGQECQFQLGYRGLLDLCRRSGELSSIHAEIAYENDELEIILGLDPTIIHKPLLKGDRGQPVLAYSVAKLKDGSTDFVWMDVEQIEQARKMNKGKSPAWESWWSEMAKKVVMKRHLKTLPLNAEIQRAVDSDETVKRNYAQDMTEAQEGETLEEVDARVVEEAESAHATADERKAFYDFIGKKGLTQYLSVEEKTKIAGGVDREYLKALMSDELPKRKKEVEAAEVVPDQSADSDDTTEAL